jgi:GNAT superfamily N-acetyltransferase
MATRCGATHGSSARRWRTIYLVPEERDQGLGEILLDWVDAEVERLGVGDMVIGVVPGNQAAQRLYERRGFIPTWMYMTRFAARVEREHAGEP